MSNRYELLPFGTALAEAAAATAPLTLTVTCSPKRGVDRSVEIAEKLVELGHRPVPHVAARMLRDSAHLDEVLRRCADARIGELFVIGGDAPEPIGAFASADELLPLLDVHPHRPARIGIAAYPEGHPLIDDDTLRESLARKATHADYLTTQMCFDPDVLLAWVAATHADGISLPIYAGMPGQVERRRLVEISMRVGVGRSVKLVRRQRGLTRLFSQPRHAADRLYDALARRDGSPVQPLAGFQYYTFNRLLDTLAWERRRAERTVAGRRLLNHG